MGLKKQWVVFSLDEAVEGISNTGIQYNEYSFTINRSYNGIFDTEENCYIYIAEIMKDYRERNVVKNTRFIALPVFFESGDEIFDSL